MTSCKPWPRSWASTSWRRRRGFFWKCSRFPLVVWIGGWGIEPLLLVEGKWDTSGCQRGFPLNFWFRATSTPDQTIQFSAWDRVPAMARRESGWLFPLSWQAKSPEGNSSSACCSPFSNKSQEGKNTFCSSPPLVPAFQRGSKGYEFSLAFGQTQPEFNWVIRDCLLSLRDEGWTCQAGELISGFDSVGLVWVNRQERGIRHLCEASMYKFMCIKDACLYNLYRYYAFVRTSVQVLFLDTGKPLLSQPTFPVVGRSCL